MVRGTLRQEIERVLGEMDRTLRPGGTLVILETLGTCATEPQNSGFQRAELRTDYRFPSLAAALTSIEFFFGRELAERVRDESWSVVPEWTGLWSRRK
jgi:ubiquinone/menaquinone biosynthesis C-methylase UbiE